MKKLSELDISPAPWRIVDSYQFPEGGEWVSVIKASNNKTVSVPTYYNARLIAAAPELYECLREAVLEMCHECLSCGGYPSYECKGPNDRCFLAKWRAALAEAAGEEVKDGK